MKNLKQLFRQTLSTMLMLWAFSATLCAQNGITVTGTVSDASGEPLIGASVVVKGNASTGTVTDFDGNFKLNVPSEQSVIVFSYVGMSTREQKVGKQRKFNVTLQDDTQLEEVIVVGYGQQKKASVVGAITQTTGEVLERCAEITLLYGAGCKVVGKAIVALCLRRARCENGFTRCSIRGERCGVEQHVGAQQLCVLASYAQELFF